MDMENNKVGQHRPFNPYIWRENRRKKAQEFESRRKAVLEEINEVLIQLGRRYDWDEIYLFGSIIKPGKFCPDSDVDIGIKGLNKFDLYSFIGDVSLYLNRNVDVVPLEECGFADKIVDRGIRWHPTKNW